MAKASASKETTFDAPIEKVWETILDYSKYPDFVDGCSEIEILEMDENGGRVQYSLNIIKKLKYILKMSHEKHKKVSWEFESGDIFKKNEGSWELTDNGDGTTGIVYNVTIEVGGFFPGAGTIVKKLTEVQLPSMLKAYEKQAQNR